MNRIRNQHRRAAVLVSIVALLATLAVPASAASSRATCSGLFADETFPGLVVHGHHVVADYAFGFGHENLAWPPAGGGNARGGAAIPGGPGPGFHFPRGIAPGASFCNLQSQSPGIHFP